MSDTNTNPEVRTTTYDDVVDAYENHLGNLRIGHFEVWADVVKFDVVDEFGERVDVLSFSLSEAPEEVLSPYYEFYRQMIGYAAGGLQQSVVNAINFLGKIADNLPNIVKVEDVALFGEDEPRL